MKKYIETLGGFIEGQVPAHPERAKALLTAAYSWVRFSGGHSRHSGLRGIYDEMNGAVAGMIVDSFRKPEDSVMVNLFMPCELLHAMGIRPMFPEGISVYLACTACQHIFAETAETGEVPETFCSYHKTMIGAAETGVMPRPLMIVNTTLACDANQLSFRRLSDFYQVPRRVIDVPYEVSEDAVVYVADQLREFSVQLEEQAHRKLDDSVLRETIARSRRTLESCRAYLRRRGNVSMSATLTGELLSIIATHVMLGRPDTERFMNGLHSCAEAAPSRSEGNKLRIFWCHTLPNWQDSLAEVFEKSGRCEIVGSDLAADWPDDPADMDPERPYESMAGRIVKSICNGPSGRRIESVIRHAGALNADGIVLFCHWGCKQTLGLSHLAKQAFEDAGLPTLVLDGDGCDSRNVADGQMVTRVNAFLEQLEGLKR